MISIKNLDPNDIKIDEKSNKNILIFYVGYVTRNSIKPLYLMINTVNGYIDEHNANKYLTLVQTDKSIDTNKYGKLWKEIKELIRLINNSDDYDEKCMKIKFNSDDNTSEKNTRIVQHSNSC